LFLVLELRSINSFIMVSHLKNKVANGLNMGGDDSSSGPEGYGEKYILRVSAGPSYDESTHQPVVVNGEMPTAFENEFMTTKLKVRIRGYNGLPRSSSSHSPYFDHPMHSKDQYSVGFSFVPKKDLDAVHAVWGNDFDHPIRDRLPPGFNYAFEIVKKFIDPAIEADAYADEPWMLTPALDGFFKFRIGNKLSPEEQKDIPHPAEHEPLEEGADGTGLEVRQTSGMPENSDKRRKHFMNEANRGRFGIFEKDRLYQGDFFNPYIDFNKFALKLPGFSLKVIKYINDKTHILRYVFKNRKNGEVYFVVNITLLFGDDVAPALQEEDDRSREASREASRAASMDGRLAEVETQKQQQSHGQQLQVLGQQQVPTKQQNPAQEQQQVPVQEKTRPPPVQPQTQMPKQQHDQDPTWQRAIAHQQNLAQAVPAQQQAPTQRHQSTSGFQYGPGHQQTPPQQSTRVLQQEQKGNVQHPVQEFHDAKTTQ
jgi:hypothetical protein